MQSLKIGKPANYTSIKLIKKKQPNNRQMVLEVKVVTRFKKDKER